MGQTPQELFRDTRQHNLCGLFHRLARGMNVLDATGPRQGRYRRPTESALGFTALRRSDGKVELGRAVLIQPAFTGEGGLPVTNQTDRDVGRHKIGAR